MESVLRKIRNENCLSQEELADLSHISIKTIQRIENGKSTGSAFSIKQLAFALNVNPSELRPQEIANDSIEVANIGVLKLMNWSAILVVLLPLSNLILLALIFLKNKRHPSITRTGKKIITVQILWSLGAIVAMMLIPLLLLLLLPGTYSGSIPLLVPVYYVAVLVNVGLIIWMAHLLSNKDEDEYWLPNLL